MPLYTQSIFSFVLKRLFLYFVRHSKGYRPNSCKVIIQDIVHLFLKIGIYFQVSTLSKFNSKYALGVLPFLHLAFSPWGFGLSLYKEVWAEFLLAVFRPFSSLLSLSLSVNVGSHCEHNLFPPFYLYTLILFTYMCIYILNDS